MNRKPATRWISAGIFIFIISFGWMFFWTWGQPFFDEDYTRWLEPAKAHSFSDIAGMIFTPFPEDWGFLDKPVELLFFKTLYSIFQLQPLYFYIAKCILFAITAILVFLLTSYVVKGAFPDFHRRNYAAAITTLLFITFEPSFLSILWLSDFEILSQLTIVSSLIIYLYYLERLDSDEPFSFVSKVMFHVCIFIIAFIGYKTKSTAKIIPLIIVFHAATQGKRTFIHFSPLVLALVVVNIPWLTLSNHPLPPILDFSKKQVLESYYWQPANLISFSDLFIGGAFRIWPFSEDEYIPYGLLQVLFPFGILNILTALVCLYLYKGHQGFSGIINKFGKSNFFVLTVWVTLTVCLLSGYPIISNGLRSRHLLFILIPVCIIIGSLNSLILCNRNVHAAVKITVTLFLISQVLFGIYQTDIRKRSSGYTMILGSKVRQFAENSNSNANIMVLDFPDTGYFETEKRNKYYWMDDTAEASQTLQQLAKEEKELYLVVPYEAKTSDPDWSFDTEIRMETGWYYDLIGSSIPKYNLSIYKFKR